MNNKRIHTIYGIFTGISAIIAGLCLITACVGIYNTGSRPFSPAAVAQAFSKIDIPVYCSLALILGGWIISGVFPVEKSNCSGEKQYAAILDRLHNKLDMNQCDPAVKDTIVQKQRSRKRLQLINAAILVICSIVFLCYGANSSNFDQIDITGSMVKAMVWFIPCLAVPFGFSIFTAYYCKASILAETVIVKKALADGAQATITVPTVSKTASLPWLRWALLAVALGIMIYGFFAGGTVDVLTKAVNICTECVGLG